MFFQRLRDNMKWIIIVIVLAFGAGGLFAGFYTGSEQTGEAAAAIAEVNGQSIPYAQFQQTYINNVQMYSQFFGPVQGTVSEELMYMSLMDLVTSVLVREAAREADLPVERAEIDDMLEEIKGQFSDNAEYRQALSRSGLNENQLRNLIREDLQIEKLEQQIRSEAEIAIDADDDLSEEELDALLRQAEDEKVNNWVEELRDGADIAIFDSQLLAHDMMRKGDFDGAIFNYEQALLLDPFNAHLHLSLGAVYEQTERMDEAIAEYEKAVEKNDLDPELHVQLALAYGRADRIDDAAESLRRAGEIDPDDGQLQFRLLQMFTDLELPDDVQIVAERLEAIEEAAAESASSLEGVPQDILDQLEQVEGMFDDENVDGEDAEDTDAEGEDADD